MIVKLIHLKIYENTILDLLYYLIYFFRTIETLLRLSLLEDSVFLYEYMFNNIMLWEFDILKDRSIVTSCI